jgi:predicted small secreted protein
MKEPKGLSGRSAFRPTRRAEARPTLAFISTRVGRLALVAALSVGLVACNTVRGVGKDIEAGGEAIQKATK